ncbi:beta-ketoacyl-[acyl-carrier-protein] synthase family protein [Streptomyces sp. DSM 40750]|uniref:beta-ketoacyl-[acyl-carrier-protein] synthase family protein n=1 Tax=Streptomyces sp. DSM 40750 TaxID=2801030 RepID=UPI00214A9E7E|nr:beta-ketoacyl-[acyl-carrier-protein] synthase family protein [Streptomyces sp. DSM 40750]UUU22352.1 beta-ketoacyl-[acyl-carrier-protein] synthase family protein [Streptomyces sp. DSM 40750]
MSEVAPRVAITGLGAVSSLGIGARAFTESLREGRSGISPIRSFDSSGFDHTQAGEVHGFLPGEHLERITPDRWGRSAQFAAAAARLAVEDAGWDPAELSATRAGSAMGTTNGEARVFQQLTEQWLDLGPEGVDAALARQAPADRIAAAVNTELRLDGEAQTFGTACAASNYAIGYGFDQIRTGAADVMLVGGADSVNRATHAGFHRLGAIAPEMCRPFDEERAGIMTAEGGAALLLESWESAVARGARIYAEVLGYALTCDAKHPTQPDRDGIAECIRRAHRNAGVKPDEVDYICAHGTGTVANDKTEVAAVRQVFGDRVPPISSIKSMLGHTMGAASGFGALACCAALHEGFLPPTATARSLDPELGPDLDVVAGRARSARLRIVENHGFAFGGNNAIVILGRPE